MSLLLLPLLLIVHAQPSYDPTISKSLLFLSYASYCSTANITSWNCTWCIQSGTDLKKVYVVENSTMGTLAYLGTDGKAIYGVFRGTKNVMNWWINFHSNLVDFPIAGPTAQVHFGFVAAYAFLYYPIKDALIDLLPLCPNCPIYVTGHSLGAAMATLAAYTLKYSYPSVDVRSITFGSPRVGNLGWMQGFKSILPGVFRVVWQKDVVPHIPPHFSYYHVPREVWYAPGASGYKVCDDSGEDPTCADSVGLQNTDVADHLMYLGIKLSSDC